MLPIVARSSSAISSRPGPKNSTNLPTTLFLRSISVTVEHEIGRGHPLAQLAGETEADHVGDQHRDRLAEHRRLRLDAADAPAEDGEAVHHGRMAVGADERIGIGDLASVLLADDQTVCERYSRLTWWQMPVPGGTTRKLWKADCAPAQEPVALAIPLIFELDVLGEGTRVAELVDDDRMVDDEVDRHQRIDPFGIAAERPHRVAHGGEVDHRRHAGEILHQNARRAEGDLAIALLRRQPGGHGLDIVGADRRPSSLRSRFSRSTLSEKGSREMSARPFFSASGRLK